MSKKTVKKILVIDNNEYSLLLISDFINFHNFQVITSQNSSNGLYLAATEKPDLIICDINMPELDGFEVLRQLRQNPAVSNIPVLFLSFEADIASRQRALQLGANGYLTKPVNLNELLSAIASLINEQ